MSKATHKEEQKAIEVWFHAILQMAGYNMETDGLKGTPARFARYLIEQSIKPKFTFTVFDEPGADELILINGISFASACEHHTLPFYGDATIGYIPSRGKVGGLSKFARVVQHFAAGLNNQERITNKVGRFLTDHPVLKPVAVGVILRAHHSCMSLRGVKCANARTTTQFLSGAFRTDPAARQEFLNAARAA